jgi:hypothetical protein
VEATADEPPAPTDFGYKKLKRNENIFLGLIGTEHPFYFGALNARL